jgi:hypothetical protein
MCDCDDDDELEFVDATGGDDCVAETGSNVSTGDAGDADSISGEGFLTRFFDVGVGTLVGTCVDVDVGVGCGEAVAREMGESASGD